MGLQSSVAFPDGAIMMPTLVCLVLLVGYFSAQLLLKARQVVRAL